MSRNTMLIIAAVVVVILLFFFIPWGGDDEVVETGAVDVTEEVDDATGTISADAGEPDLGETETAADEAPMTTDTDVVVVETDATADEEPVVGTDDAMAGTDMAQEDPPEEGDPSEVGDDSVTNLADMEEGDALEAPGEASQNLATDGIDSASEAVMIDEEGYLEVLTVDGFDIDEAQRIIEESGLSDTRKATLLAGIDAARDQPEELAQVLERAREDLLALPANE